MKLLNKKQNGMERKYVIKNELIKNGWTNNMINRFLGSEDLSEPNHINHRYPNLKFYRYDRVLMIQSKDSFIDYCIKYLKHRIKRK